MAFTFVEIEQEKSRAISGLLAFLCTLYALSLYVLCGGAKVLMGLADPERWWLSAGETVGVFGIAAVATLLHWLCSTHRLVERVVAGLQARPVDPHDIYHAQFQHIVEEVSVATGGRLLEARVMPTVAANACAVAGFDGRAVIVVTEGLLARCNRAQLEAVVGHEAAHVVSGDCLTSSVFCGLFAMHEEVWKGLGGFFDSEDGWPRAFRGRLGVLVLFTYVVVGLTRWTARLAQMCISREKEYRADATAVRLTRDPLALAEALTVIERQWRGAGAPGEAFSPLFILDTGVEALSEQEGWFADLFATHPPTASRIATLVRMAHLAPEGFAQEMAQRLSRPASRTPAPTVPVAGPPAAAAEPGTLTGTLCPRCQVALRPRVYEGVTIPECPACGGRFVRSDQLSRIFARREYAFSDGVQRLGRLLGTVRGQARILKRFQGVGVRDPGWRCPDCRGSMVRKFFTTTYLVAVEQCFTCGLAWVDREELELLQYIHEQSMHDASAT